jgi:integrase/recombinase XerC
MSIIYFQQAARRMCYTTPRMAPTITMLILDWQQARCADGFRPHGVTAYGDKLRQFVVFAGDIPVTTIDDALVEAYKLHLSQRGLNSGTIRNALTVLRTFCAWCVARGYIDSNLALAVRHPRVEPPNPDPLTREQIALLLALCDAPPRSHKSTWRRNRRACFLMLYGGLRLAEAAGVEWRDVDLMRGEITIRREIAKGGRPRVVPICAELDAELRLATSRRHMDAVVDQGDAPGARGLALKVKSLAHIFERWLALRGLKIHSHQLRKTFATELYVAGEDIATIQRLLGHSDPKTTMRYIGASAPKERAAVQKLRFRE